MRKISFLLVLTILFSGILSTTMFPVASAATQTITIALPEADTYTRSASQFGANTTNYGLSNQLALRYTSTNVISDTFLKWHLVDSNNIPIDTTKIISAKMHLYFSAQTNGYMQTAVAYPVASNTWKEGDGPAAGVTATDGSTVTYSASPTIDKTSIISSVVLGTTDVSNTGAKTDGLGDKEWDLTNYLKNYTGGEFASVALCLTNQATGGGDAKVFTSKDEATLTGDAFRPYLEITLGDTQTPSVSAVSLKDASGNPVTALTSGGKIIANVTINSFAGKKAKLLVALYNSKNMLTSIKTTSVTFSADGALTTSNLTTQLPSTVTGYKYKLFVLDSTDTLTPIALPAEFLYLSSTGIR